VSQLSNEGGLEYRATRRTELLALRISAPVVEDQTRARSLGNKNGPATEKDVTDNASPRIETKLEGIS
jgi:hypothetical protein